MLKSNLTIFLYFPCMTQHAAFQTQGSAGVFVNRLIFEERFWILNKGNRLFLFLLCALTDVVSKLTFYYYPLECAFIYPDHRNSASHSRGAFHTFPTFPHLRLEAAM